MTKPVDYTWVHGTDVDPVMLESARMQMYSQVRTGTHVHVSDGIRTVCLNEYLVRDYLCSGQTVPWAERLGLRNVTTPPGDATLKPPTEGNT